MLRTESNGAVVRVTRYNGMMRKHAGYRAEPIDALRAMLNEISHQPTGERAKVLRRRAGATVRVA